MDQKYYVVTLIDSLHKSFVIIWFNSGGIVKFYNMHWRGERKVYFLAWNWSGILRQSTLICLKLTAIYIGTFFSYAPSLLDIKEMLANSCWNQYQATNCNIFGSNTNWCLFNKRTASKEWEKYNFASTPLFLSVKVSVWDFILIFNCLFPCWDVHL